MALPLRINWFKVGIGRSVSFLRIYKGHRDKHGLAGVARAVPSVSALPGLRVRHVSSLGL